MAGANITYIDPPKRKIVWCGKASPLKVEHKYLTFQWAPNQTVYTTVGVENTLKVPQMYEVCNPDYLWNGVECEMYRHVDEGNDLGFLNPKDVEIFKFSLHCDAQPRTREQYDKYYFTFHHKSCTKEQMKYALDAGIDKKTLGRIIRASDNEMNVIHWKIAIETPTMKIRPTLVPKDLTFQWRPNQTVHASVVVTNDRDVLRMYKVCCPNLWQGQDYNMFKWTNSEQGLADYCFLEPGKSMRLKLSLDCGAQPKSKEEYRKYYFVVHHKCFTPEFLSLHTFMHPEGSTAQQFFNGLIESNEVLFSNKWTVDVEIPDEEGNQ